MAIMDEDGSKVKSCLCGKSLITMLPETVKRDWFPLPASLSWHQLRIWFTGISLKLGSANAPLNIMLQVVSPRVPWESVQHAYSSKCLLIIDILTIHLRAIHGSVHSATKRQAKNVPGKNEMFTFRHFFLLIFFVCFCFCFITLFQTKLHTRDLQ